MSEYPVDYLYDDIAANGSEMVTAIESHLADEYRYRRLAKAVREHEQHGARQRISERDMPMAFTVILGAIVLGDLIAELLNRF